MAAKKVAKKKVAKKPATKKRPVKKKPVNKKTVTKTQARPGTKVIKKDIKSIKKGLKKEVNLTQKVSIKASQHDRELDVLRAEIEKLKKKKKRSGLSEYQRFMRIQIKKGLTFKQAAALWSKQKKQAAKKDKRPSGYNIFISIQLKQGKTMKQAIAAWNELKNPKKKRKRKPKVIVETKIVRVKSKPKVIVRTVTSKPKVIVRTVKSKPQVIIKTKKMSDYNMFISVQLKQGKTMKQATKAWKLFKNPPKKRKKPVKKKVVKKAVKKKTKTVKSKSVALKRKPKRKPVKKKVKKKAVKKRKSPVKKKVVKKKIVKKKTVKRIVKKKVVQKPRPKPKPRPVIRERVVVSKPAVSEEKISEIVSRAVRNATALQEVKTVSKTVTVEGLSNEELALNMLDVYFTEVARHGLKRSLVLDEVINAYFYALVRVERKGVELNEFTDLIARGRI